MKVHGIVSKLSRVFERNIPDRGSAPPLSKFLLALLSLPQSIKGCRPVRVIRQCRIIGGEDKAWRRSLWRIGFSDFRGTRKPESHGQGLLKFLCSETNMFFRAVQLVAKPIHRFLQICLTAAGLLKFLINRPLFFIRRKMLNICHLFIQTVMANALPSDLGSKSLFQYSCNAAKLLPNSPNLIHQNLQYTILFPLRKDEVAAKYLICRLKLPINPAIPLIKAAGIPG